ncbi:transposase (plasmid) [Cytobacillus oceanisediminis]|uniref:DUF6262 family protein n=1 Tax=Cytobacillus oceanisediminis TaxID=665099 RepID=UPI0018643807|nr:DUF6262 family protein [Cytobacillus oceanisediminis]QOK29972.1 transposase [Cytobacillus oceanisediminis]
MSNYDRKIHLKSIHASRKALTEKKVNDALKRLIKIRGSINFNNVANESGVSKATLYNHPEIRDRIETLRQQQANVPTPKQVKREMNESNKDAIIASLKRKNKKLEDENQRLKKQLKIAYSDVYKNL